MDYVLKSYKYIHKFGIMLKPTPKLFFVFLSVGVATLAIYIGLAHSQNYILLPYVV